MTYLNIDKAKKYFCNLASSCIQYNQVINISTKEGNVILLGEKNYNNLIESLYLVGVKGVCEDIEEAVKINESIIFNTRERNKYRRYIK